MLRFEENITEYLSNIHIKITTFAIFSLKFIWNFSAIILKVYYKLYLPFTNIYLDLHLGLPGKEIIYQRLSSKRGIRIIKNAFSVVIVCITFYVSLI